MGVPPGVPYDVPHVVSFEAADGGRTKVTVTEYGYTTERARDVESPMQDSRWSTNPPANDGAKINISDTDHYSPMKSDALWAWKSFFRGHNPIFYDLGIVSGVKGA
jgi:hypothetical protein